MNAYWTTFWVISGLLAIALLGVALGLNNGPWSLTDALADKDQPTMKVQIPVRENGRIKMTDAGTPVTIVTEAHPSSASRLIALLGTLVLIAIMLGVGYGMIWSLFTKGQIPALEGIGPYLLGGGALFAPYAFNQLKEAFRKN